MSANLQMKSGKALNDEVLTSLQLDTSTLCKTDYDNVLGQPCFLDRLRFEQHRAQRSGSALSIIVLTQIEQSTSNIRKLLKSIQTLTRETDIAGYLNQHTVGVLLPYTDEQGVKKISQKIKDYFNDPHLHMVTSTYPDEIFDSLAKKGCVSSDVLKLILEDLINHSWFELQVKEAIDIVGSTIGLLVFSPLMLVTAILIKMTSPGPVIFKQTRLGKKGVPFTFYKFRSMRTDVSDQLHRDYVLKLINGNDSSINHGDSEKPLYKIKFDPRVTRIGRFIRKTSIDELPQLYNVLKGDMSLVGPRPPLAYEAEKYQTWHLRRILEMKPGITGLWQVEGRSRTGFDDAVRLDVRYLKTWSLMLDINILLKTVMEVLRCRGAV